MLVALFVVLLMVFFPKKWNAVVASQFDSQIYVENNNARVNAKSIMGMMTLGMGAGEDITVSADGGDEQEALDNIEKYLKGEK